MQGLHCIAIEKTGLENFVLQYTSLYCRLGGVVLQDCIARGLQENCIAIQKLYCDSRGSGLLDYVATQGRDTASQATTRCWTCGWELGTVLGAGQARRAVGVAGRWAGAQARADAQAGVARAACGSGSAWRGSDARGRRGARQGMVGLGKRVVGALGALVGYGLCTRCTRPVFDPI